MLVVLFRSSGALASAYGIAVTGTMVVTAILALIVVWKYWKWPLWAAAALMVPFLLIDLTFLGANLLKVLQGGWVPLLIGAMIMVVMITWRKGASILAGKTRRLETPIDSLIEALEAKQPLKVPGTAVFLTADPESAPTALLHSLKHYKVLHEHNVVLTMITESTPRVTAEDRVSIEPLGKSFTRAHRPLRLHGDAEHPQGARPRAEVRLELRHHVDLVLPVAALGEAGSAFGHAALAGPAVHHSGAERRRRIELFPAPHRPRGRDRHASHGLVSGDGRGRRRGTTANPA